MKDAERKSLKNSDSLRAPSQTASFKLLLAQVGVQTCFTFFLKHEEKLAWIDDELLMKNI